MKNGNHQKRNTFLLGAAVLLVCGIGLAWTKGFFGKAPGITARIQVDGETAALLELSEDTQMTIGDPDGDYNVIVVKDGSIAVTEADCADKICVKTGEISQAGEMIACLPHKLIIYIEESG